MQLVTDRGGLRAALTEWRRVGEGIALVPTMGNLHEGHLALVDCARRHADRVVTSVYVNPTQFGEGEDFESYPRSLDADREKLEAAACDLLFAPASEVLYPFGVDNAILLRAPAELAGRLEGRFRPGHFDGVVSIVTRLFNLVEPDCAVFGEKDYQQLLMVRRMVEDLGYPIEIIAVETRRAASGLALSTRNAYLDAGQLKAAEALNGVLRKAASLAQGPDADFGAAEAEARDALEALGMRVDYVAVRRARDLAPPVSRGDELRILAAAWCGSTRLIDNLPVGDRGR